MKIFLIIVILFIVFAGCTKQKEELEKDVQKDTTTFLNEPEDIKTNISMHAEGKDERLTGVDEIKYNFKDIPAGIKYNGKLIDAAKWTDRNGENILLITETEDIRTGDKISKELFGYLFIREDKNYRQLWKITDFVRNCEFDLTLTYLDNSINITDLDDDGIAENSFLYALTCRSDVSPADMKLIMHEDKDKYAIRGTRLVRLEGESYGGEMKTDASFSKAPKEFLSHAIKEWERFKEEKFY